MVPSGKKAGHFPKKYSLTAVSAAQLRTLKTGTFLSGTNVILSWNSSLQTLTKRKLISMNTSDNTIMLPDEFGPLTPILQIKTDD